VAGHPGILCPWKWSMNACPFTVNSFDRSALAKSLIDFGPSTKPNLRGLSQSTKDCIFVSSTPSMYLVEQSVETVDRATCSTFASLDSHSFFPLGCLCRFSSCVCCRLVARNVPMITRRSVCYLGLLGILILASVLFELPQLRLPVIRVQVRSDDADVVNKRSVNTNEATSTTAATTATPNGTAWCILDRNNTAQYFRHFPHALQSVAPCWSYVCRQRERRGDDVRCGVYIQQPLRFPWEEMSSWTVQLLEAMGCRIVVQQENTTEPFEDGDVRARVSDWRVSHYSFFERKEDVQLLQARVMGAAAAAGADASDQPTKDGIRIGFLQRIRTRPKRPDRVFLNVPDIRSSLQTAFPDATIDETDMRGFSLKEQAEWWYRHDVVVAGHGAALTNSIFLRNGEERAATVIEVFPDGFHPYIFGALLKSVGVHRLTIDTNASVARGKSSDLRPDPALVVRLVQQAIGMSLPEPEAVPIRAFAPPPPPPPQRIVAYTRMRSDRSGSVVHDLLHAHAYCFANNITYGGSCAVDAKAKERSSGSQLMVDFLGLSQELKLACPRPGSLSRSSGSSSSNTTGGAGDFVVLDKKKYAQDDLLTRKWLSYVNARRNLTAATTSDGDNAPLQVAVYVRRGDVTPCVRGGSFWRYLPNSYYLRVLDHYLPSDRPATVRVYSPSKSPAENFDDFRRRNYSVLLDAPIGRVWDAIMTADVAVLSRSSFSYVPAIFNTRGTVLYTNFWHKPPPWWVPVNRTIQQQGAADLRLLQGKYCPT
jgi:Glycosyltransferase 61